VLEPTRLDPEERDERAHLLLYRLEPDEGVELGLQLLQRPPRLRAAQGIQLEPVRGVAACGLAEPIADQAEPPQDVVEWTAFHDPSLPARGIVNRRQAADHGYS
jgi:hypothetical protein